MVYIIPARYTEEELLPIQNEVREFIAKGGGKIFFEDNLGKKRFAYPIKKINQGYYLLSQFSMEPDKIQKLDSNMRLSEQILRHIIVKRKETAQREIRLATKKFAPQPRPAQPEERIAEKKEEGGEGKIRLEDLDKKLDEIIDKDIL